MSYLLMTIVFEGWSRWSNRSNDTSVDLCCTTEPVSRTKAPGENNNIQISKKMLPSTFTIRYMRRSATKVFFLKCEVLRKMQK